MELKVDISYEEYDKVFLQILYDGYETCYSCYKEDFKKYDSDRVKYDYKWEDIQDYIDILEAYETLADHYTSRDEGKKALQKIRDKINYGSKLIEGMSDGIVRG